ncbi:MAG TPA: XDD4 family exosortase-dependent surface protein [Roseateles sp.]|nr:XDD4 family exosortase-dependent surface protein [Roseateles sp.]
MKVASLVCAALAAVAFAQPASAAITFTGVSGDKAASATFDIIAAGSLQVTLTNTSGADTLVPTDVLTALFFSSGVVFTPVSATLAAGSSVLYDPQGQPAGGNVGGEWAYGSGLSGTPGGANSGISSSGYGVFGGPNFNGPDLEDPVALDGLQYGIVTAGDDAATGNAGVTGSGGLIKNSVVFMLSYSGAFALTDISTVSFQYGTSLTEPNVPCTSNCGGGGGGGGGGGAPEPGTIALVGLALLGAAAARRGARS